MSQVRTLAIALAAATLLGGASQARPRQSHIGVVWSTAQFGGDIKSVEHPGTGVFVAHFGAIQNFSFCSATAQQYAAIRPLFLTADAGGSAADGTVTVYIFDAQTLAADTNFYVTITC